MIRKLLVLFVFTIISFSYIGMSLGNDNCVSFISVTTSDNETIKNVGVVFASINSNGSLDISVANSYPNYEAYVDFVIQNADENIIYVNDIVIINNNPTAFSIIVTGINIGDDILPGDTVSARITLTILSGATENYNYNFGVDFSFNDIP